MHDKQLYIGILYPIYFSIAETYWEYIESFGQYSSHHVKYLPVFTRKAPQLQNLECFDALVLHYGLCLYRDVSPIGKEDLEKITNFKGLKIYIAQDEYTTPQVAVERLKSMGIHHMFSCISTIEHFREIYPESELPKLTFDTILTGYVSKKLQSIKWPKLNDRRLDIVYRGNNLGLMFGRLGAEKAEIGMRMKELATTLNLKTDIKWNHSNKIFGKKWLRFLCSGRIMLCTESGSSLIHHNINTKQELLPTAEICSKAKTVEEFRNNVKQFSHLLQDDGRVIISAISPKIFEAVACGTVLLAYEGEYSGILKPNVHYIPLKKDWSNIDEVIAKVRDLEFLEYIQENAYKDLIVSDKYTYKSFINRFDNRIEQLFQGHGFIKGTIRVKGNRKIKRAVVYCFVRKTVGILCYFLNAVWGYLRGFFNVR